MFYESRDELIEYFKKLHARINITLDIWRSPNYKSILGVTAHWIDNDWKLKECLIDAVELVGNHTGKNIADHVYTALSDYGIQEKFFCITADNASNNSTMAEELHKKLDSYDNEQHLLGKSRQFFIEFPHHISYIIAYRMCRSCN